MMIIAIVGADGAGKSTVTAAARRQLLAAEYPARVLDRWDIVDNPAYPTAEFMREDPWLARSCAARMSNPSRALFLMWASAMALTDERRGAPEGEITLLDGYWMKHAASEVASGLDRAWIEQLAAGLPQPDLTVYLRCTPELAWERKNGQVLPYECGMDLTCSRPSFLAHQRRIHDTLDAWADAFGWVVVDATAPLESVLDLVVLATLGSSRPCA
jgi:dTMP kinase